MKWDYEWTIYIQWSEKEWRCVGGPMLLEIYDALPTGCNNLFDLSLDRI